MAKYSFLNSRELKGILSLMNEQWGIEERPDYVFLMNEDKLYIVNRDIESIDLSKIRINSIGLYFGEYRNGELRLTIEGSQIVGPGAKKNVLDIDIDQSKEWMMGKDLAIDWPSKEFLIIRCGKDYLGTGKAKDGNILNFVPKIRRLNAII